MLGDYNEEQKEIIRNALVVEFEEGDYIKPLNHEILWTIEKIECGTVFLEHKDRHGLVARECFDIHDLQSTINSGKISLIDKSMPPLFYTETKIK